MERTWHNPPKEVKHGKPGKCPFCKIYVKNVKAHIESKHKGEKLS